MADFYETNAKMIAIHCPILPIFLEDLIFKDTSWYFDCFKRHINQRLEIATLTCTMPANAATAKKKWHFLFCASGNSARNFMCPVPYVHGGAGFPFQHRLTSAFLAQRTHPLDMRLAVFCSRFQGRLFFHQDCVMSDPGALRSRGGRWNGTVSPQPRERMAGNCELYANMEINVGSWSQSSTLWTILWKDSFTIMKLSFPTTGWRQSPPMGWEDQDKMLRPAAVLPLTWTRRKLLILKISRTQVTRQ